MLRWYYSVDTLTVLEITDRVNWPDIAVGAYAEEGSGWSGELLVDDPDGDLMMLCHRRIYAVQDAEAADHTVVGNWFITDLDVIRDNPPVEASRKWIVTMVDENSLLERRLLVGTDAERPAENTVERIRWLLTTTEANTLDPDETYIDTTYPVDMDACDYTGQRITDVIADCQQHQAAGWNFGVVYREDLTPHVYSLLYFNFNTSSLYQSTLSLSNVESEVRADPTVYAIAGGSGTRLSRSGMRLASGGYRPFSGGYSYQQNATTGTTYVYRDVSMPSINVKSQSVADTMTAKDVAAMNEPDDEITTAIVVDEANLNQAMHGMSIALHATHLPDYTATSGRPDYANGTTMRIKRRDVTQLGPTTFRVGLVLTPMTPTVDVFLELARPQSIIVNPGESAQMGWAYRGDDFLPFPFPTVGPLHATAGSIPNNSGVNDPWAGVTFDGAGTINIASSFRVFTACTLQTVRVDFILNGTTVVATDGMVTTAGAQQQFRVDQTGIAVSAGDVLTAFFYHDGEACGIYNDGTGDADGGGFNILVITGTLSP